MGLRRERFEPGPQNRIAQRSKSVEKGEGGDGGEEPGECGHRDSQEPCRDPPPRRGSQQPEEDVAYDDGRRQAEPRRLAEVLPPASERLRGHPRGLLQPISAKEGEGQFDRDEEGVQEEEAEDGGGAGGPMEREDGIPEEKRATEDEGEDRQAGGDGPRHRDRKSTRLNSSHRCISY